MSASDRDRYTAFFCEENIWWLADRIGQAAGRSGLEVWLLSNPDRQIAVAEQRAAAVGALLVWDYHVVLRASAGHSDLVYDFDTRLPFPVSSATYLARAFAASDGLPAHWRAQVRVVPADDFLRHFSSDRRHMQGCLPAVEFPQYPPIMSDDAPVTLMEYVDMGRQISGTRVRTVEDLKAELVAGERAG